MGGEKLEMGGEKLEMGGDKLETLKVMNESLPFSGTKRHISPRFSINSLGEESFHRNRGKPEVD
jgi:hypothetical protein